AQADKSQHVRKTRSECDIFRLAWAKLVPVFGTGGFAQCSCGDFLCKIPGWIPPKLFSHIVGSELLSPLQHIGAEIEAKICTKNRYQFFLFPLFSAAVM